MGKPNILYIHSHDTGRHVQPHGFQVPTPNLQLLADQGVFFREAFCASPSCSASRASLLTGRYGHQNGMMGLAHRGWRLNDYGEHIVHPLRAAGYHSVLIGEQHLATDPSVIGYDEIVDVPTNYVADVAPAAATALREAAQRDSPFFMSVGFFETHREFQAPASVRDALYSMPPDNVPDTLATREDMAAFKSSVRTFDQGVGAVLNELHRLGLDGKTLVVCTTDHGLAFPRAKATLFDRGTGVLLLMRGPDGFSGGKVIDAMVSHLDLYPTLCELAGADAPEGLSGLSLLPLVREEAPAIRKELFTEMTFHAAYEPVRAIRTGRWKYIRRFHDYDRPVLANCDDSASKELLVEAGWRGERVPVEQLYDLILDPGENRNLAAEPDPRMGQVRGRLRHSLAEWMAATDDPIRHGPIEPPAGAIVTPQDAISPAETEPAAATADASGEVR